MRLLRLWSIFLVISVLTTLFFVPVQAQNETESPQEKALRFVSNTHDIPISELMVIDEYATLDNVIDEKAEIIVIQETNKFLKLYRLVIVHYCIMKTL